MKKFALLLFIVAFIYSCFTGKPDNYDIKPHYKLGQKVYLKPDSLPVVIRKAWRTEAGPQYEGYYKVRKIILRTTFYEFEVY